MAAILSRVGDKTTNPPAEELDRLLTPSDIAKRLSITPQTVLLWEKAGRIPSKVKCGRVVRFDLNEVLAAIAPERRTA